MVGNTKFKIIVLLLICLVSVLSIIQNKPFYYSELDPSIVVKFGSNQSGVGFEVEKLDTAEGLGNVSKVDETALTITYQHNSLEDLTKKLNEKFSTNEFIVISSSEQLTKNDYGNNLVLIALSLIICSFLSITYFKFRKGVNLMNVKFLIYTYIGYIFTLFTTSLITLGILSIISRKYMLTVTDLYSPILSMVILSLIFNFASISTKGSNFKSTFNEIRTTTAHLNKYLYLTLVFVISITLGLGLNFLFPAVAILIAIISPILVSNLLSSIFLANTSKGKKNTKSTTHVEISTPLKSSTDKLIIQKSRVKKQSKARK